MAGPLFTDHGFGEVINLDNKSSTLYIALKRNDFVT